MELILASSSPRRQELLRAAKIPFSVRPSNVPEEPFPGETPLQFTARLAQEKASAIWPTLTRTQDVIVLGADTIVVVDDEILGKPVDSDDAARMLRMMSNRSHQVITSVCVIDSHGRDVRSETTVVTVNELSAKDIAEYIASGEPMDKAGAYGIQGMASRFIPRIQGDYTNIVGLPITLVCGMLKERGYL